MRSIWALALPNLRTARRSPILSGMSMAAGHRLRWIVIWALIGAWFVALALNLAGNLVHLLLLGAIALLVYELLIPEQA